MTIPLITRGSLMATQVWDIATLPDYATRAQVAEYTQTSVPTLARWAGEGQGPKFIKLGGSVRYKRSAVVAWLQSLEEAS
jgi:excisionase family DNA binding protein